ncbi:MAG TPA: ribosome recycling factor [Candidatus Cloacimonetes bacterium]|nr:ribosome recycling factor [Candidatus Cloacimonadota bacterium]HEX37347.1 ribosome recycling factor [Candidatus Cloacimonadota bacterium]
MQELESIYKETRAKMDKTIDALRKELLRIRTGKANISLLEDITVNYYGQPTPISHVGTISTPEARLILINPWEKNMLQEIEKSILSSDLGITPQNDGNVIRLVFPPLTEDRRKELVKLVKKHGEEAKISIRNTRRSSNDEIKKLEKDSVISEDYSKDGLDEIQEITDDYTKKIDEIVDHKEKEIMEI